MINTIKPGDEKEKKSLNSTSDDVLHELKDEKNVSFDADKVKLPETEFTNVQEALAYIRKQENLLLQKNRENNSEAIKELKDFVDILFKERLNPENLDKGRPYSLGYNKETLQKLKDFFENYKSDLSGFMMEIAQERKKILLNIPKYGRESNNPNGCKL